MINGLQRNYITNVLKARKTTCIFGIDAKE